MKRLTQIISVFCFCLLTSCNSLLLQNTRRTSTVPTAFTSDLESITPTRRPTRVWTPVPTITPHITQLPEKILGDIFISNYTGSEIHQFKSLIQKNLNKLSSFDTEISTECKHSGQYGILLKYSIKSEPSDYDFGVWGIASSKVVDHRPIIDITNFKALEFWVKGTTGAEIFDIIIAHEFDEEPMVKSSDYVTVSPIEWQLVHIPLSDFWDPPFIQKIWGVEFLFYSSSGTGSICIDDITFVP